MAKAGVICKGNIVVLGKLRDIVLVNPSEGVRQVFELLGLTSIFRIVKDQNEAVAAFQ